MISYRQPGTVVTEHRFEVPLRHSEPGGERISVFAREVVADEPGAGDRPVLVFLQGGPGQAGPRTVGAEAWLGRALTDYRVLLLDQRGTGRSTPANRGTLAGRGDARAQAEYLTHFRADSIVADCELIRRSMLGDEPWTVLGQSFGGFCTLTYLSFAPDGMALALLTGGLAGLTSSADDVYRLTYPLAMARSEAHYARYPSDRDLVSAIVARLADQPATLPDGGTLTVPAFQSLGAMLGMKAGSHRLHYLLEYADPDAGFSDVFLADVQSQLSFAHGPLYALLHEACYAQGEPTRWSAQRVRAEFPAIDADPTLFTGEMIYPWMFATDPVLRPLREVADILADWPDWPPLYDPARLARNTVPVRAAIYFNDLYVPTPLSLETAAAIPNLSYWITNEWEHDGLRTSDSAVLGHLLALDD